VPFICRTGLRVRSLFEPLRECAEQVVAFWSISRFPFNPGSSPGCACRFVSSSVLPCSSLLPPPPLCLFCSTHLFFNFTAHGTLYPVDSDRASLARISILNPSTALNHSLLPSNIRRRFAKPYKPKKHRRLRLPQSRTLLEKVQVNHSPSQSCRSSAHYIPQSHSTPVPPLQLVSGAIRPPQSCRDKTRPSFPAGRFSRPLAQ
jgi:hypothetical protein